MCCTVMSSYKLMFVSTDMFQYAVKMEHLAAIVVSALEVVTDHARPKGTAM